MGLRRLLPSIASGGIHEGVLAPLHLADRFRTGPSAFHGGAFTFESVQFCTLLIDGR